MHTYTRQEYISNKCTHHEYYSQFATDSMKNLVGQFINKLKLSDDNRVIGLDLDYWDYVAYHIPTDVVKAIRLANDGGISLSDRVCALKTTARILLTK